MFQGLGRARSLILENHTLLAANAAILFVMAGALYLAGRGRRDETYWRSWWQANVLLGVALVFYIVETRLPPLLIAALPNGLLLAGLGLRWRAARQFGGRSTPGLVVWGPALVFALLCAVPLVSSSYGRVYTLANIGLAALSAAAAYEFLRDREDRLPSRYGLVAAYAIMAASFAVRVFQGALDGDTFGYQLPLDIMLTAHLAIALVHTTASGAFALSIAYERGVAKLAHAASHDPLTGLLNRRAFEQAMHRIAAAADAPLSLLLVDIDHFKRINDRYGHAAGDTALRACADICRRSVPASAVVARIGGEEFAVVLPGTGPHDAVLASEILCKAVHSAPIAHAGQTLGLTVSVGLCHGTAGDLDLDEMMRIADKGLYKAKRLGRNRAAQEAA